MDVVDPASESVERDLNKDAEVESRAQGQNI
jgi:hypothetical protein